MHNDTIGDGIMRNTAFRISRKRLAALVVAAALVLAAVVLACGTRGVLSAHYRVNTTEGRQRYLHDLGWEIDIASEDVRETVVPETFDEMLTEYNAMQRAQGFDLAPYTGKSVTLVTYEVTNYPAEGTVLVQLWICGTVVIAGDVHATAMDGFLHGIVTK